jgi:hypothetical protein
VGGDARDVRRLAGVVRARADDVGEHREIPRAGLQRRREVTLDRMPERLGGNRPVRRRREAKAVRDRERVGAAAVADGRRGGRDLRHEPLPNRPGGVGVREQLRAGRVLELDLPRVERVLRGSRIGRAPVELVRAERDPHDPAGQAGRHVLLALLGADGEKAAADGHAVQVVAERVAPRRVSRGVDPYDRPGLAVGCLRGLRPRMSGPRRSPRAGRSRAPSRPRSASRPFGRGRSPLTRSRRPLRRSTCSRASCAPSP